MGTVACCARTCCKCCLSCSCWNCCMDTYLHVYIRSIELDHKAVKNADANIAGTADIYCEIIWGPWRQITGVNGGERGGVTETEPIILENARPDDKEANGTLIVQVWDSDESTGDDFIAQAEIHPSHPDDEHIPLYYGQNLGEKRYELKDKDGKMVGHITLDQIHFIKQKLMPYRGCKCQGCCCNENKPFLCCLETAKSLTYQQSQENKKLLEKQNEQARKVASNEQ